MADLPQVVFQDFVAVPAGQRVVPGTRHRLLVHESHPECLIVKSAEGLLRFLKEGLDHLGEKIHRNLYGAEPGDYHGSLSRAERANAVRINGMYVQVAEVIDWLQELVDNGGPAVRDTLACGWCEKESDGLDLGIPPRHGMMLCGLCRAVAYCGVECQRQHWGEHKKCCVPAAEQPFGPPSGFIDLLLTNRTEVAKLNAVNRLLYNGVFRNNTIRGEDVNADAS